MLFKKLSSVLKNRYESRQLVRWSHSEVTYKGQNLPFKIANHRILAIKFVIYFGIPFATPFFIVRYHLLKASAGRRAEAKTKACGEKAKAKK